MKKLFIIAVLFLVSFATFAQAESNEPQEIQSFEVKQTYTAGNTNVAFYELPKGSVLSIYKNNGSNDLVADVPNGGRRIIEKNVKAFAILQ